MASRKRRRGRARAPSSSKGRRLPIAGAPPTPILESRLDTLDARVSSDGRAIAFAAPDKQGLRSVRGAAACHARTHRCRSGYLEPTEMERRWPPALLPRRERQNDDHRSTDRTVPHRRNSAGAFRLKRSARLQDVSRDGRFLLLVPVVRAGERPISVATAAVGSRPSVTPLPDITGTVQAWSDRGRSTPAIV